MNEPAPWVSIIINARDEGGHVERTVASALAAAGGLPVEVVLINDGSLDHGFDFLARAPWRDDRRIVPWTFAPSVGLVRARHQGMRLARGRYVFVLDAHMALPPGCLGALVEACRTRGPEAVVMPRLAHLDEEAWAPHAPFDTHITLDPCLDFTWAAPPWPTGLLATVSGGCYLMERALYFRAGGYDLGLRRWGGEHIDLGLKVWAQGGGVWLVPEIVAGHLFREGVPYAAQWRHLNYNKLRVARVHFPPEAFRWLVDGLRGREGFGAAWRDLQADLPEIDALARAQEARRLRPAEGWVRAFLPDLLPAPPAPVVAPAPRVSVIVPGGPDAAEAAFEVLRQTDGLPVEVLVVEAGAPRDLPADARVRLVAAPGARTAAARCNAGAREARGAWLAFVSPGQRLAPGWLEARLLRAGEGGAILASVAADSLEGDAATAELITLAGPGVLADGVGPSASGGALAPLHQALWPRELFLACGGLFEGFSSLLAAGVEVCHRAWARGVEVRLEPLALVEHPPGWRAEREGLPLRERMVLAWLTGGPAAVEALRRAHRRDGALAAANAELARLGPELAQLHRWLERMRSAGVPRVEEGGRKVSAS